MRFIQIYSLIFGMIMQQTFAQAPDFVKLSQELLYSVKMQESSDSLWNILKTCSLDDLQKQLFTDNHKKAFWINIYNAYVQKTLSENPNLYQDKKVFFRAKSIIIGGKSISLDDIEHGILRRSKVKLSWGYLNKWFPSRFEKKFRVQKLDYRIHFALNCGAKSCPPIAFYKVESLENQLDLATQNFLTTSTEIKENIVVVSKLFSWFRADFGGKKGIKYIVT